MPSHPQVGGVASENGIWILVAALAPTVDTVGTGDAVVFHSGQVVEGTWERGSITDPFFLTTSDGTEIVLPPGRVWISLQPNTQDVVWE